MSSKLVLTLLLITATLSLTAPAFAECALAHTHIGVNPTWRPDWSAPLDPSLATDSDDSDDNKLWFFSLPPVHPAATPGWPEWKLDDGSTFLQLVPYFDGGSIVTKPGEPSKQLWYCNFHYDKTNGYGNPSTGTIHLDGWHSAHGPQGKWNLQSIDEQTEPDWDIYIQRQGTSVPEDDFMMALSGFSGFVLANNGDTYQLSNQLSKFWLPDKNAWGFHEHMSFAFWLTPDIGQTVTATFSAYDASGMYDPSDDFVFEFETVPEPATLTIFTIGAFLLRRRRK
jgi:hypothetical protein